MKVYIIILSLFLLAGCETAKTTQQKPKEVQKKSVHTTTKIYGFQFLIPDSFVRIIDDVATEDLKGEIRSRETAYQDSITGSELHIIFHPRPYGKTLFDYYYSLIEKNKASTTSIAGLPAVHYEEKLTIDGKGHPLAEVLVRDKYFVLDHDDTCLELVVNRKENDELAKNTFQKLIKDIKK